LSHRHIAYLLFLFFQFFVFRLHTRKYWLLNILPIVPPHESAICWLPSLAASIQMPLSSSIRSLHIEIRFKLRVTINDEGFTIGHLGV
jgi:hypothetical protein